MKWRIYRAREVVSEVLEGQGHAFGAAVPVEPPASVAPAPRPAAAGV